MRVLIVDDHEVVRRGVRALLSTCPECQICGEAVNGEDAIQKARELRPDVIVMDISMPKMNGLEATRQVRRLFPEIEVLMLSQHESDEMVRQSFNSGALGYVVKSSIARDLVTALQTVTGHEPFFDPSVSGTERRPGTAKAQEILQHSIALEQALRESEELYRSTFELAAVGVAHLSCDGRFLRANKKLGEILGYAPEELIKLKYQDVTHPAYLSAETSEIEILLAGGTEQSSSEKRYIRKNGSSVWVKRTISAVRGTDSTPKHFISVIEDITERKEAEFARFRLAAIVESSDDAIISKDLNGVISSWNIGAQRIFEYTAEEAIGRSITLIIPRDLQDEEKEILRRLRSGERIEHFETVRVTKSGKKVDISLTVSPVRDARGKIVGASKIARDISERKRIEAAFEEGQERLRLAQAAAQIGTWEWDPASESSSLSPDLHRMFRTSPEGKYIEEWQSRIHPDDREKVESSMQAGYRDGSMEFEYRYHSPTQGQRWFFCKGRRFSRNDSRMFGVLIDITKRKEAELAQQTLREQLEERVRERTRDLKEKNTELLRHTDLVRQLSARLMQSQDEERRRIARELHDSAGQIIAALQLNLLPLEAQVQALGLEASSRFRESIDLIGQLSTEVRTISHLLHPPLLDEAGLSSALRWYVEGYAERSKISVDLQLSPDLGRLSRDMETAIFRMVQECLTNINRHSESPSATIRVERTDRDVRIEVRDQGKGIRLGRRSEPLRPGVGIQGMQERVHQLGGQFEIKREIKGTVVTAVIPIQELSSVAAESSSIENGIAV